MLRAHQLALQDDMAGRTLVAALNDFMADDPDPLSAAITDALFSDNNELRGTILRCRKRSHIMRELTRLLGWKWYNAAELRALRRSEIAEKNRRS